MRRSFLESTDWNCNLSYDFRNISGEKVYTAFEGNSKKN